MLEKRKNTMTYSYIEYESPLSQRLRWGRGVFLLFGVFAWPSSADTAAGALRVPLVDGLWQPAARAAY